VSLTTCPERITSGQVGSRQKISLVTVALSGLGAGLAAIFYFIGREQTLKGHVPGLIALLFLAGLLYLAGVYLVDRYRPGTLALILVLAASVLFRVALLPADPAISDDVYRYQWDGRVQRANLNPYEVFPAMAEVAALQDHQHPLKTGTTTPTVYPPLSELVFRAVETVAGYKRLFTLFDLGSIAVLLALLAHYRLSLPCILVYAWNPGIVISFALSGHLDSMAIFTLLCAFLFLAYKRPKLSLASLALSVLSKFFAVALLPVFLKKTKLAGAWIFGAVLLAAYVPFLGAGAHLLKGLSNFSRDWENNDSAFRLIRVIIPSKQSAELVAAGIVLALLAYVMIRRLPPLDTGLILTGGILLVSPNAFPWYFTWLVPYLCFFPKPSWLLMSVTSFLGYAPVVPYAAGQAFRDSPFLLAAEYLPVYALLAYEIWRGRRSEANAGKRVFHEQRTVSSPKQDN
jgi:alpha-1,6-mannosyltransferase